MTGVQTCALPIWEYVETAAKRLNAAFTEKVTVISPGVQVRLRSDFPDNEKSRRLYFKSRGLNLSDAAVFEFILSQTVNSAERQSGSELSHSQIAAATKLSRRTVIRSVKRLTDLNFIGAVKDKEWHRGNANRISIASSLLVLLEVGPSDKQSRRSHQSVTRLK